MPVAVAGALLQRQARWNQGRSKAGGENGTAKALRSGRAFKSGVRGKRTWILLYV